MIEIYSVPKEFAHELLLRDDLYQRFLAVRSLKMDENDSSMLANSFVCKGLMSRVRELMCTMVVIR